MILGAFPFSPMDNVPEIDPFCAGLKVTLIVQLNPGANDDPQLLVSVYTVGAVVIDWIVIVLFEALARVTGAVAAAPTVTLPKFTTTG
jgi:hypothetical protein